jgi:hypothetical protein
MSSVDGMARIVKHLIQKSIEMLKEIKRGLETLMRYMHQ